MKKSKRFSDKTDGLLNWNDLNNKKFRILYWGVYALLLLFGVICLFPVIWMFLQGFMTPQEIYSVPPTIIPSGIDLKIIPETLKKVKLLGYLKSTLFLIAGCWVVEITFNGLCGYFLAKIRSKGHKILNYLVFWSMLLPGISMVPLYCFIADIGLLGSYVPIWLMCGANAFNILLFRNFFLGIPDAYMEAARIDGCSNAGIFMKIMLPLSKPVIMVVSIFNILGTWGNFFWPYLLLQGSGKEPIAVFIYRLSNGMNNIMENEKMLLLAILTIPPFIVFAFLSKYILGGLNMSGVKG